MKSLSKFFVLALTAVAMVAGISQDAMAWGRFEGGPHPAYGGGWAHHDPVIVHRTVVERVPVSHGCVGCGIGVAAVAGLVGGAIIGAAIASNNAVAAAPPPTIIQQAPPQTIVVQQAPPPQTVVVAAPVAYPVGSQVSALPGGCANMNVNNVSYYQCGTTWYQPFFGANGVYYTVIPAP